MPDELLESCGAICQRTGAINRALDVLSAVAGLLLVSPLFLIVAVAIKLDDGGAVFYRQVRVGRGFRPFQLLKFRSMIPDADRSGTLTTRADSRVTPVGRWLRRSKIDELPQLWNVLRGDMRLVGPRPEVERYVNMFRAQYAVLLLDRPGITDPTSIAYRREEQTLDPDRAEEKYVNEILPAKVRLSLDYQKQRTLWSDMHILLRTAWGLIS